MADRTTTLPEGETSALENIDRNDPRVQRIADILRAAEPADATKAAIFKNLELLASETARFAARMKYLAMAASCIASGSTPAGPERENCVAYLLDTLESLGDLAADSAENIEQTVRRVVEGVQS